MSVGCTPTRDMDLLMLAHGELGFIARVRTQVHLMRCSACRKRLEHFVAISSVLNTAVAGLHPSQFQMSPRSITKAAHRTTTGVTLALLLVIVVAATELYMTAYHGSFWVPSMKSIGSPDTGYNGKVLTGGEKVESCETTH